MSCYQIGSPSSNGEVISTAVHLFELHTCLMRLCLCFTAAVYLQVMALPLIGIALLALLGLPFVSSGVTLTFIEFGSQYHPSTVRLSCDGDDAEGTADFFSTVGQTVRNVTLESGVAFRELSFLAIPENEGMYHCEINGEQSNLVTIVGELMIFAST